MAWDTEAAERSTQKAEEQYKAIVAEMNDEQKEGVIVVLGWMLTWYNGNKQTGEHATGWKALCHIMQNNKNLLK